MKRFTSDALINWYQQKNRKPAIVRGARQVGKTWLIHDLAERLSCQLVELNFEQSPELIDLFSTNNPIEIILNIEAELDIKIDPKNDILFLDEIQSAPELLAKLRWFKEKLPSLAVVAAGSLLEFVLKDYRHVMPVGRVTYFYLEPMSYFEFLLAGGYDSLYAKLSKVTFDSPLPQTLHNKCLKLFNEYCLVGGMPEVLREWYSSNELSACLKLQKDLIATYRDDFYKYGRKINPILLAKIMSSIARQVGSKFVYSQVSQTMGGRQVKEALSMLSLAKICCKVTHAAGNGIPLGAESNEKFQKVILLDIGLVSSQLGLTNTKTSELEKLLVNKGGLAEQFIGQHLRILKSPVEDAQLFYWQRTGRKTGEIDYLIQFNNHVIPIEVKSGSTGSMKSLHQFMYEKKLKLAVRFDSNPLSSYQMKLKTTTGHNVSYQLVSIPHYLVERLDFLLE